jgi:OOP family OmpA-OmpF porin
VNIASFPILIKFIDVLMLNSDLKLEIAVHTGDKGFLRNNLEISERYARNLNTYFLNNGITSKAVHCKGYGESRPRKDENVDIDVNLNKRIEFIFINNLN